MARYEIVELSRGTASRSMTITEAGYRSRYAMGFGHGSRRRGMRLAERRGCGTSCGRR